MTTVGSKAAPRQTLCAQLGADYHRLVESQPGLQTELDCVKCGACCFSELSAYVRVWGADYERLGEQATRLTHFIGNRCYLQMSGGHCAALRIVPDVGRFECTVYASRPATCRELSPGSPQCAGERHAKGDRPARALRCGAGGDGGCRRSG